MNRLENWLFKRIVRKQVIQGSHKHKIIKMFSVIIDYAREEFTEDNTPTLDSFIYKCFKESLNREPKDNPFHVVYDYDKAEPKEQDIKYTFHTVEVTKEELEKLYPKKDV